MARRYYIDQARLEANGACSYGAEGWMRSAKQVLGLKGTTRIYVTREVFDKLANSDHTNWRLCWLGYRLRWRHNASQSHLKALLVIGSQNRKPSKRQLDKAWGAIEAQMQRRDLQPAAHPNLHYQYQ